MTKQFDTLPPLCGIVCGAGPSGEPVACAYQQGHEGPHSWATLPTFVVRTEPYQTRTILHVGDRQILSYPGEPPGQGDWVTCEGRLYIVSKIIWQFAAQFGGCTVDVLLAPIPASFLSGVAQQAYETMREEASQ